MLSLKNLSRLSRPLFLLLAAFTYSLGAGIAHYLGYPLKVFSFGLGLLSIWTIQVAAYWLNEYFHLPSTLLTKDETIQQRQALQAGLFNSAMALMVVSGAVIITLFTARLLSLSTGILFVLIIIFYTAYAIPPLNLVESGYGELVQAISLGTLFPALAFLLQAMDFHRLLTIVAFPLTLLALSYLLVIDFSTFASDQKYHRHTLLTRLTWQNAIPIHHILILLSFLFLAIVPILGIPWNLVWPAFLVLPFGLVQVIWIQRMAIGGPAFWKFLLPLALTTFGLTAYLLMLAFWIR